MKAASSGNTVRKSDLPAILGMINRGDRNHDIAAWFGLNQGRIAEVKEGKHGSATPSPASQLPPSGSPGPKARILRHDVDLALQSLHAGDTISAVKKLVDAIARFDKNE